MATLVFDITADNRNFKQKLDEVERSVKTASSAIEKDGRGLESVFQRLTTAAAGFGAAFGGRALIQSIIQTRGEMQQLEVAFRTMLQSEEKASSLIADAVDFAAKTPFSLQGVASGIRQLLAYQVAAEDAIDTVEMLGNVAAGLSMPLGDLVYLYGTLKSQGRAMLVDIRQFAGRGVPIYEELSKVLGVSVQEVNGLISAGKVGFPEVEQAFKNMTSAGGMFYNLMQEQSKTITGQISNLEDAFSQMLNNIGQASEGIISKGISGVSYLIENYEKVSKTLAELVAAYGVYRTALITISALEKARIAILQQTAVEMQLAAAAGHRLSEAQAMAAARAKLATAAQKGLLAAINASVNPYALAAAGVAALGYGIYKLATYQTDAEKAMKRLDDAVKESNKSSLSEERNLARLKGELSGLEKGTSRYNAVKNEIIKNYSKYYEGLDEEIEKVGLTEEAYRSLTESIRSAFGARQYESFAKEQSDTLDEIMSENLERIQERLIKRLGDEAGAKYYARIREAIFQGNLSIGDNAFDIKGLDSDTMSALDRVAGEDGGLFDITNRALEKYISNIIQAMDMTESLDRQARERFGIDRTDSKSRQDEAVEPVVPPEFISYQDSLDEAERAWKDAKIRLQQILDDRDRFTADAYKEAVENEKAARQAFQSLGGVVDTATDTKAADEAADAELDIKQRLADAEYELQRKSTDDRIALIEMERQQALSALQAELAEVMKVYEAANLPTEELQRQYERLSEIISRSYDIDIAKEKDARLKETQEEFDAILQEVETYEQARLRIQEEYAEKRKALTDADGSLKDGVTQGNLDELTRQEQEALESISVTFAMRDAAFEQWSRNLASQTAAALDLMLSEAMEQLSILENTEGVNPEEIAKATAKVVEVREALRKAESDTDASEAKWTKLNEVLRDSASVFSQLGEVIPGVAGQLLSGIGSIATSAVSMANAINGITTATTALEKASGVIAAVSAGLQVLSAIPAIINANKEANEAAARAAYEYAQALQEVADAQMLASNNSIFGDNAMASFFDNMAIAKRELGEIQEVMDKAFEREQKAPTQGGWVLGGWLGKAPTVNDYTITSDMRSGWQKFWGSGRDNIHTINLQDYVNQDGILDYARLEAAYNAYKDGIAESDRQLIEELIANGKQYEAAMEEAASYISGLFSDLSGNIADAMIDAFQKTGNAAINTGDIISDVAKNFAKSWIENKLLEDIFNEKAQDRMFALMEKGDTEGALDYLSGLIGEANALAPQITEYLRGLDGLATEIEEPEQERTSTAKGIAQASQDSVDENNARLTTIQGHTYSISADMKVLVSASAMMLDRLAAIETNTARLENIESGIAQMRSDISYMNTKGLFLRK